MFSDEERERRDLALSTPSFLLCAILNAFSYYPWGSPGKNTGVGCHFLLQDPDAGKDWRKKQKRVAEDEMVAWYHRLSGHESEQTPGDSAGQGSLACCSPRGCKESGTTQRLNNKNILNAYEPLKWSEVLVAQSCLTLGNPMDFSPPGSSVHEIFQARILEWVAISFSRGSSGPRDWTWVSCTADRFFTNWAMREAQKGLEMSH